MNKKIVYQFKPFIKVVREDYSNKYESKKNFHQIYLQDSAMVVLKDKKGQVLFLKEYRRGLKKLSLGLPGGNLDKNEKPLAAVKRELLEETGFVAKKWKLLFKYKRHGTYDCGSDHVFIASNFKQVKSKDKIEKSKKIWMDKKKINLFLNKKKFETGGILATILFCLFKRI